MLRIGTMIALLAWCCAMVSGQDAAPGRVRVSTNVMLGMVAHKTMPVYPDEAMKKGIQGDVTFKIEVDETGKIAASVPGDGDPLLIAAAKDALQTFSFHPYLLNGSPVKVQTQLGFHFSTEKTGDSMSGHVECITSTPKRP
jgi:TonB family protein